jgi:uncharacterized protein (TIGR02265 family)
MSASPVVYSTCIESLFLRGLRGRLTARCKERLRQAGLDVDGKLEPSYPLEQWKEFLRLVARELYPVHPAEAAYRELGMRFMDGFLETFIGKATMSVLRVLGPHRAVMRLSHNLRAGNNFSQVEVTVHGPMDVEVWLNDVFADHPAFTEGLLHRGHTASGAQACRVETLAFDGTSATLRVRWEGGARRAETASSPSQP